MKKIFIERVISELKKFYGDDADVTSNVVVKTNGVRSTGIVINKTDKGNLSPVIYIDNLYEEYERGLVEFDEVIERIINLSESNEMDKGVGESIVNLLKWDNVKPYIYPVLINTQLNLEMLENLVSVPFLDLSLIFIVSINDLFGNASIKVTNQMLSQYNVTVAELYELALDNLKKETYEYQSITKAIGNMIGDDDIFEEEPAVGMYVLSNKSRYYSSGLILDTNYIEKISGGDKLYFIPSSIHEWIVIKADSSLDPESISQMVREVNETSVEPTEILADHVYEYEPGIGLRCA